MKASDYISVGMIAIVGTVIAYFLLNSILGDPVDQTTSFEYIKTVQSTLSTPNDDTFNAMALNPTVEVYIGSCRDLNKDGKIDDAELVECGEADPESALYSTSSVTDDDVQLNRANGLADGTSAEQREQTLENINTYTEEVNSRRSASETVDSSARSETVSTGN